MKALCKVAIGLALGLAPTASFAQDLQWRVAGSAAPAAPTGIVPVVGLSRPVPLNDAAAWTSDPATLRPIVRGQNAEDSKPLPQGPPLFTPGSLDDTKPQPLTPFTGGPEAGKTMPKAGEFVPPQPQPQAGPLPKTPSAWTGGNDRLLGINGACGNPNACCDSCTDSCANCGCGWYSRLRQFCHLSDPCCNTDLCCNDCKPCMNLCCDPCCNPCCNRPRVWVFADYLLWKPQNQGLPPLVTTSPAGTPLLVNGVPYAGVLGGPATTVAFDRFSDPFRSGMRVGGGVWFSQDGCWGMDASYWFLSPNSQTVSFVGNGSTEIFRPINSVALPIAGAAGPGFVGPDFQQVAFPGALNGGVTIHQSQEIWGAEINLRRQLCCSCNGWVDLLLGFRHFTLNEDLDIGENLIPLAANGAPVGSFLVSDRFRTTNNYNAPQIGIASEWYFASRWSLASSFRVGLGVNSETVNVEGNQVINGVLYNGGILALPSNIGTRTHERFAVMPELNLKVGYDITPNLRAYAGFDFLWISSVVRPGRQIDLNVNLNQVPPNMPQQPVIPFSPAPLFRPQDMWISGFNFGLLYKY